MLIWDAEMNFFLNAELTMFSNSAMNIFGIESCNCVIEFLLLLQYVMFFLDLDNAGLNISI